MRSQHVAAGDVRLHVLRLGEPGARPVVFLHGLVMDHLASWYFAGAIPTSRAAATDVVLYDLRGHGKSERPPAGYDLPTMVADLRGLLDALEITRPAALVGNSYGGLLALAFALTHPERADRLVLVDAHLSDAEWGDTMAETLGLEGDDRDRKIAETFRHWPGRSQRRRRDAMADRARALVGDTSLIDDLRRATPLADEALAQLEADVLALYGEDSDILSHGRRLAALAPRCELRVLEGCGHSVLWEAPEQVQAALVAHVTRP